MANHEVPMVLIDVPVVTTDLDALRLASVTSGKPVAEYVQEDIHDVLRGLVATDPVVRAAIDERIAALERLLPENT